VPGFHLYEAMRACSGHLTRFGGHRAAAGCSIHPARLEAFRADFDAHARRELSEEMLVPEVRIDLELSLAEANGDLYRLLKHAAPFGMGNPTPVFAVRGARVAGAPRVVGTKHLRLTLAEGAARLEAIGFGMGERIGEVEGGEEAVDVAFKLEENSWNGRTTVQARIVDLRPSR
jgi:single-stranded-DNA-specific exonuclease